MEHSFQFFSIIFGSIVDELNVRRTLIMSSFSGVITLLLLGFLRIPNLYWINIILLFFPMAFSTSLGTLANILAVKRYTTPEIQDTGYTIYYTIMNISAIISGPIIDITRIHISNNINMNIFSILIILSAFIKLGGFILSFLRLRDIEISKEIDLLREEDNEYIIRPVPDKKIKLTTIFSVHKWASDFREALKDAKLLKLIILSIGLTFSRSIFRYLDAVYPVYIPRLFGESSENVAYMSLLSINPAIVITLTIPVGILFKSTHPVTTIIFGTYITSLSPFFMILGARWWAVVSFITILSLGEIFWSPVSYSYSASLSPTGKEGIYLAMAGIPTFLSKFITGPIIGALMNKFCPSEKECDPFPIWMYIGCTTLIAPLWLFGFRKYVTHDIENNIENDDYNIELID